MIIEKKDSNLIFDINLKNLAINYQYLKQISSSAEVAVSVKANSYGLGVIETCTILIKNGCKSFFVATSEEGIFLRKNFSNINIYVLNGINDLETYLKVLKYRILVIFNNSKQLDIVRQLYNLKKKKIQCGIHVDSGMNRLGFDINNFQNSYKKIKKYLDVKIVISHLSCSEQKDHYYRRIEWNRQSYSHCCSSRGC